MSRSNRISVSFTDVQKNAVIAKIKEANALMPFLTSLTVQQREELRKMGPKSIDYVRQSIEAAKAFPNELKKNFDVAEMDKDYTLINNLLGAQVACKAFLELIEDTMMAAGVDVMEASDEIYSSMKTSAKNNANVKAMVDKMAERFANQGKKTDKKAL